MAQGGCPWPLFPAAPVLARSPWGAEQCCCRSARAHPDLSWNKGQEGWALGNLALVSQCVGGNIARNDWNYLCRNNTELVQGAASSSCSAKPSTHFFLAGSQWPFLCSPFSTSKSIDSVPHTSLQKGLQNFSLLIHSCNFPALIWAHRLWFPISPQGSEVLTVVALDGDRGKPNSIHYCIVNGESTCLVWNLKSSRN